MSRLKEIKENTVELKNNMYGNHIGYDLSKEDYEFLIKQAEKAELLSEKAKFQPNYAVPPAETMMEVFEDKGITLQEFSDTSGIPLNVLHGIVQTTESIDKNIAAKLEEATGVVSSFWVNLENNYRATLKRLGEGK